MNTPAHLILGAAVFGRADRNGTLAAALAGSLVPDLSLYIMASWALYVQGIPPETVFGTYYFSPQWQGVFAVDNSIVLWGGLLAGALWLARPALIAFAASGVLHLIMDFSLHNDDARRHFWPVTDWVFHSPLSYWDRHHYGDIIGPIEIAMCIALTLVLWRRFRGGAARAVLALLVTLELLPGLLFHLMLG